MRWCKPLAQWAFTYSKPTKETLEKGVTMKVNNENNRMT